MKLEANVTRFGPENGYIYEAAKEAKAIAEADGWIYRFISPGYYLCITEDKAYAISMYKQKIGCGCADMTYNCTGKEVCKHLIMFMRLENLPDRDISEEMRQLLIAAGWSGTTLTPPNHPSTRHQKRGRPNIKDPERKPAPQAAQRATKKESYEGKTAEEIVRGMGDKELESNARKGGVAARAEVDRREAERAVSA